jgi:hypothetical protein
MKLLNTFLVLLGVGFTFAASAATLTAGTLHAQIETLLVQGAECKWRFWEN